MVDKLERIDMGHDFGSSLPSESRCELIFMARTINNIIDYIEEEEWRVATVEPTNIPEFEFGKHYRESKETRDVFRWKVGDTFWYIECGFGDGETYSNYTKDWNIRQGKVFVHTEHKINKEPNIFRTQERAEKALEQLKEVMIKNQ